MILRPEFYEEQTSDRAAERKNWGSTRIFLPDWCCSAVKART